MSPFTLVVTDLLGHAGARRETVVDGVLDVAFDLAAISGPVHADVLLEASVHGVVAKGTVSFEATLSCNRCLTEWSERFVAPFLEAFEPEAMEGAGTIGRDGTIDLESTVRDEAALALPLAPLCRPDCLGICPTCGTDLNTDPCAGHVDESNAPFGALRQLLEP